MLYTRKGDNGTTTTFGCDQRMSKSSMVAEALGSLDEINSFLGLAKIRSIERGLEVKSLGLKIGDIVHGVQETLFIVQAEVAGFNKSPEENKITDIEKIIDSIEKELPPIKTFFISGGTELAATFDFARTIARQAERRVIAVTEEGKVTVSKNTLSFLNRLSSLLYALARYSNFTSEVKEKAPSYK